MTAISPSRPLCIDRPGAAPIALDKLTLFGGLEVPHDLRSPIWARADVLLANQIEYRGAVRITPPQRTPGAPPLSRLTGVLILTDGKLINPVQAGERLSVGLTAREVLPIRLRFEEVPPYPLRLVHETRDDKIEPGAWSRALNVIDFADDISRLSPL